MDEQRVRSMLDFVKSIGDRKSEFEFYCILAFKYNDPEACYKAAVIARDEFVNLAGSKKIFI